MFAGEPVIEPPEMVTFATVAGLSEYTAPSLRAATTIAAPSSGRLPPLSLKVQLVTVMPEKSSNFRLNSSAAGGNCGAVIATPALPVKVRFEKAALLIFSK